MCAACAKIFQKAMYSRLSQYLHTNNILAPAQYAFRKGKSTEGAAFRLTDSVLNSLNQKLYFGGIFFDLSKAFACANHEILLTKLHSYGIHVITIDWFMSYLTNRKQKVEIKSPNSTQNLVSDWGILKHGVPQGFILGSLLFLVYINYLSLQINSLAEPIFALLENSAVAGMADLSARLIHRDWSVITIPDGCQVDTK